MSPVSDVFIDVFKKITGQSDSQAQVKSKADKQDKKPDDKAKNVNKA